MLFGYSLFIRVVWGKAKRLTPFCSSMSLYSPEYRPGGGHGYFMNTQQLVDIHNLPSHPYHQHTPQSATFPGQPPPHHQHHQQEPRKKRRSTMPAVSAAKSGAVSSEDFPMDGVPHLDAATSGPTSHPAVAAASVLPSTPLASTGPPPTGFTPPAHGGFPFSPSFAFTPLGIPVPTPNADSHTVATPSGDNGTNGTGIHSNGGGFNPALFTMTAAPTPYDQQPTPGAASATSGSAHTDPAERDPFLCLLEQLADNEASKGGPSELDFFLGGGGASAQGGRHPVGHGEGRGDANGSG